MPSSDSLEPESDALGSQPEDHDDNGSPLMGLEPTNDSSDSELLIQSLLKERQSIQSQNKQLWRLVDKQRTMILGLQKDLEKMAQDKNRYKKKFASLVEQQKVATKGQGDDALQQNVSPPDPAASTPASNEPIPVEFSKSGISQPSEVPSTPTKSATDRGAFDESSPVFQAIRRELESNHPHRVPPPLPLDNAPMPVMGSFPRSPKLHRTHPSEDAGVLDIISSAAATGENDHQENTIWESNPDLELGKAVPISPYSAFNVPLSSPALRSPSPTPYKIPDLPRSDDTIPAKEYIREPTSRAQQPLQNYSTLLLSPVDLPVIDVRLISSRIRPSRSKKQDDYLVTLGVFSRIDDSESWRTEKDFDAISALDKSLHPKMREFSRIRSLDRSAFYGHAPSKVDARKAAIDHYFNTVLNSLLDEFSSTALCTFLSTDVVEPVSVAGGPIRKEGFLTKRGKNFGGWKPRYFLLEGAILRYYESPGGAHIGNIHLPGAQIGRQVPSENTKSDSDSYRHAFLILERKKNSSSTTKHILCTESDELRDEWVRVLMECVDADPIGEKIPPPPPANPPKPRQRRNGSSISEELIALNFDEMPTSSQPVQQESSRYADAKPRTPSPSRPASLASYDSPASLGARGISRPVAGGVITDTVPWSSNGTEAPNSTDKKSKKKSFWGGFALKRNQSDLAQQMGSITKDSTLSLSPVVPQFSGAVVFGIPLEDAVKVSRPTVVRLIVPSVCYRCIEYLEAKLDYLEEGIMRLSGSNNVIKKLRDRFDTEGDVNLIAAEQYYDVHAIAGLLKLYLRELPANILTRELHRQFIQAVSEDDYQRKLHTIKELVYQLPNVNYTLLFLLCAHLLRITSHSEINKMTPRNIGIVFSPTLSIPAAVFSVFLSEFDYIFQRLPMGTDGFAVEHPYPWASTEEADLHEAPDFAVRAPNGRGHRGTPGRKGNAAERSQYTSPRPSDESMNPSKG